MSRVSFTKLNLKKKEDIKIININDIDIEVKQYLPIEDKINIIKNVLELSDSGMNYPNPIRTEVYLTLEIIYNYTNLSFTEKQKEDAEKLYDLFEQNGIINQIIAAIPQQEYNLLTKWMQETSEGFYKYRTSALGIFEQISADYSNLKLDAEAITNEVSNPDNLTLLKDVVTKLG